MKRTLHILSWCCGFLWTSHAAENGWGTLQSLFDPPEPFKTPDNSLRSPLRFQNGDWVQSPEEWLRRRKEIIQAWSSIAGDKPPTITAPRLEILSSEKDEGYVRHHALIEIARRTMSRGFLLVPDGNGPFPGVVVPYYDPETSVGLTTNRLRDFALQLTRRGFVTISIGSPGGDARRPELGGEKCQPLMFLASVASNARAALARRSDVDAGRIGIVGHSYGAKWAMFASCLDTNFACAAWSDGGIVFDESRPNVNYWEPWYLGRDPAQARIPGAVTPQNPRTGAYARLVAAGHNLHELHALMAPRPFLVSGGSEDGPARWSALAHAIEVNRMLGHHHRIAMTHRPDHSPTEESNRQIYEFFERYLKPR